MVSMTDKYDKEGFDKDGWHRIHYAADKGDLKTVKAELDKGVNVNIVIKGNDGRTALFMAAANNQTEAMKELIRRGADVDKASVIDWTPLMVAAREGHEKAIKLLLAHKANTSLKLADGRTLGSRF